jgi:hypothetical protein
VSSGGAATSERRIGQAVLDALSGVPSFVTAPVIRRWHTRWGATDAEVAGPMPGDQIVPRASFNATRAITIDAPPEQVWPWIVQMGYRRAGFYTYALLDNAGYESADRVMPAYQDPKVGDWMPMSKRVNETTAFKVKAFEPTGASLGEAGQHVVVEARPAGPGSDSPDHPAQAAVRLGISGLGDLGARVAGVRRLRDDPEGPQGDQGTGGELAGMRCYIRGEGAMCTFRSLVALGLPVPFRDGILSVHILTARR